MPTLDMPLAQLQEYKGTNPRPKNFDRYWEEALEELAQTPPMPKLVPAAFQVPGAECFHLWFNGVEEARLHALYVRPIGIEEPHPAILQFHGYSSSAGSWSEKLAYVSLGYSVASLDCRGQGGRSEDKGGTKGNTLHGHIVRGLDDVPEKLLYRQIFLDTVQLANVVMGFEEVDEKRVGAMGASQGGGLALACGALHPGIARVAAQYPYLCDYRRVWEMDLAKDAYQGLHDYFRSFDPFHVREEEVFEKLGYIDVQNLAERIRGEVLFATGLQDDICPPSTQFAAYNKIRAPKQMLLYPDFAHETLPEAADRTMLFMLKL